MRIEAAYWRMIDRSKMRATDAHPRTMDRFLLLTKCYKYFLSQSATSVYVYYSAFFICFVPPTSYRISEMKLMARSLLATLTLLAGIFHISTSTAAPTADPTRLFDWAEKTYPNYFPAHVINASVTYGTDTFIYRYYPKTKNYLGLNLRNCGVYVLGTLTDGDLLFISYFSQFDSLADGYCF